MERKISEMEEELKVNIEKFQNKKLIKLVWLRKTNKNLKRETFHMKN